MAIYLSSVTINIKNPKYIFAKFHTPVLKFKYGCYLLLGMAKMGSKVMNKLRGIRHNSDLACYIEIL